MKQALLVILCVGSTLFASSLENKYPSYSYVFNEFDVDESYIYNDEFVAFSEKNEKHLKTFYRRSLLRGKEILPTMQNLLVEDGVSDLFIYLSMVESGFNAEVVSPKKAVGLWQFMEATAKYYDLDICNTYDERCDTVSSTSAAITYLNKLHKQFGKWYLAAMAYNCGEGCMKRAIQHASSDDLAILTNSKLKYLPSETRDYIKKLLLVAMIGENMSVDFGQDVESLEDTLVRVEVAGGSSLKELANLLEMKEKELFKLNKSLINRRIPKEKKSYEITIPLEKIYRFYLVYHTLETGEKKKKRFKSHMLSHYVKLGETLESIAKLYEADVEEIKQANHLKNNFLLLESLLVIPVTKDVFELRSK